jgi:hypothetical protein
MVIRVGTVNDAGQAHHNVRLTAANTQVKEPQKSFRRSGASECNRLTVAGVGFRRRSS